jgi:uncharacterized protein YeaO (DUF488 family)
MGYTMKRVYEPPEPSDGYRVLVDRLWPRGVSKERARLDQWLKEIAPSVELRKEWHGNPDRHDEFVARYMTELDASPITADLLALDGEHDRVTLLYSSHDPSVNHVAVLLAWLGDHGASIEQST